MFNIIKSLMNLRFIISFGLIACTGLFSFASTKLAFIKFHTQGLISLGDAINIIGVVMVLSSLSIESGLIRKLILIKKENFISLKSALVIIYILGVGLGIIYILLTFPSASWYIICTIILYLPFSILRSYLVATEKQHLSSILMLVTSISTLGAVVTASSANEIFNLIIIIQFVLISISLILTSYFFRKSLIVTNILKDLIDRSKLRTNWKTSTEMLRFSFHSMASGFQNNQAMLTSRFFLVTFVGVDFAGQMEMYQRPLIWLYVFATTIAGLFFYPFILNKIKKDVLPLERLKIQLDIFIKVVVSVIVFVIISSLSFPFLYWITFEYDVISYSLATFWIIIFSLRFFGALLSSWMLAKNNIKGAIIGEVILYLPLILVFNLIPGGHTFGLNQISFYLVLVGLTSLLYLMYFVFCLKLYLIFVKSS